MPGPSDFRPVTDTWSARTSTFPPKFSGSGGRRSPRKNTSCR